MLLGDLGARVIKVEHPDGDVTRGWGPPHHTPSGMAAYYLSVNRNKESIVIDLSKPDGVEAVRLLAKRADVLVENFAPGALARLGLSLDELRRENPHLVTASITGFGRTGPDAVSPGFDLLAQAGAGLMAVTGETDGRPAKVGVAVSDLLAGCYTAIGVLAALDARDRTGVAGHVEIDLFSSTLASLVNVAQAALVTGQESARHGNAHPQIVPYRPFDASDGEFILAVGTDPQFARLCEIVERPAWREDPRFATNAARVVHRAELERDLEAIFRKSPRAAWLDRCREKGIPAGPVRGPLEALRSSTARALGAVRESEGLEFVASPIRVSGHAPLLRFPPALDADGPRLRREFGLPQGSTS
jgi:crotonobetainyl-CoA:carnitine CoA-transferase CaiB-like acyl-CoA transferase